MMRFAWVILLMAAVGVGVVHLRLAQNRARTDIQRLEADRLKLRRTLWEQQQRLAALTGPQQVRQRMREMALELSGPEDVLEAAKPTARQGR
jgi:hypothetical protein